MEPARIFSLLWKLISKWKYVIKFFFKAAKSVYMWDDFHEVKAQRFLEWKTLVLHACRGSRVWVWGGSERVP